MFGGAGYDEVLDFDVIEVNPVQPGSDVYLGFKVVADNTVRHRVMTATRPVLSSYEQKRLAMRRNNV